jgi:parallel beta-helix repeat protein
MKRLLIILIFLSLTAQAWGATYYVCPDGNGAGATDGSNWANCMDGFDDIGTPSAGDFLYLRDDDGIYRETLTPPSSGSSIESPITYAADDGESPIISGADIISTWAENAGTENIGNQVDDVYVKVADRIYYVPITTSSEGTLESFKFYCDGGDTSNVIFAIYSDSTGSPGSLVANTTSEEKESIVGGLNTATVTSGATLSAATDYWIAVMLENNAKIVNGNGAGISGVLSEVHSYDATFPASAGSTSSSGTCQGVYIVVSAAGVENAWEATVNTEPELVFFNEEVGTKETGSCPGDLDTDQEWCWVSNTLYQYSATDPDTRYTSPGTEATQRDYGIEIDALQYINITGLTVKNTSSHGIFIHNAQANGNVIVDNCTLYYTREVGVYFVSGHENNTVQNSTATYCGCGFYSWIADNNSFINNTAAHSIRYTVSPNMDGHGIGMYQSAGQLLDGNLLYGNFTNMAKEGEGDNSLTTIKNNFTYDPQSTSYNLRITDIGGDDVDVYGNIMIDGGAGEQQSVFIQGERTGNFNFYHNIIYNSADINGDGLLIQYTTNTNIKNNIIQLDRTSGGFHAYRISNDSETFDSDYNIIYGPNLTYPVAGPEGDYTSVALWSAASGDDAHSLDSDPLFNDPSRNDFTLQPGSPAIDSGTDLGATYDDALTDSGWPNGVSTADQDDYGDGWDIGAYLYLDPASLTGVILSGVKAGGCQYCTENLTANDDPDTAKYVADGAIICTKIDTSDKACVLSDPTVQFTIQTADTADRQLRIALYDENKNYLAGTAPGDRFSDGAVTSWQWYGDSVTLTHPICEDYDFVYACVWMESIETGFRKINPRTDETLYRLAGQHLLDFESDAWPSDINDFGDAGATEGIAARIVP